MSIICQYEMKTTNLIITNQCVWRRAERSRNVAWKKDN